MYLKIYNLKGIAYNGEIESLNVKTAAGEITILDHHLPLISILEKGDLKVVDQAGQRNIFIEGGFLEVQAGNLINILAN